MPFTIIQSTPHQDKESDITYLQLAEAKAFAEVFMVDEEDPMIDQNRRWEIATMEPWVGCYIMDVHQDYSIIIREI